MASFSNIRKELLKIEKFYSEKVNYYSETLEILKEKADTLTTQGVMLLLVLTAIPLMSIL
jgi:hypothetical protein